MRPVIGCEWPPLGTQCASLRRTNRDAAGVLNRLSAVDATHVVEHEVADSQYSPVGTRYTVAGKLTTPQGRRPLVRTVWVMEAGNVVPRLVSAYPLARRRE